LEVASASAPITASASAPITASALFDTAPITASALFDTAPITASASAPITAVIDDITFTLIYKSVGNRYPYKYTNTDVINCVEKELPISRGYLLGDPMFTHLYDNYIKNKKNVIKNIERDLIHFSSTEPLYI